jgi:hypothetical protein
MMPLVVKEQAQVPPPAYHRAQARLGPALHTDTLSLVMSLHLLTLCRLAHGRGPPPLPPVPKARLGPIARNPCCSSRSCVPICDSFMRICVTGYAPGQPWPVACPWERMVSRGSLVPPNSGSVDSERELPLARGALCAQCPHGAAFRPRL